MHWPCWQTAGHLSSLRCRWPPLAGAPMRWSRWRDAVQPPGPKPRQRPPHGKADFIGRSQGSAPRKRGRALAVPALRLNGYCGQSRAVPFPPLPRPRPAELTATPMEPTSEKLTPASVQSDQPRTPTGPAPAPDEPNAAITLGRFCLVVFWPVIRLGFAGSRSGH
jgi:hypothetical protein